VWKQNAILLSVTRQIQWCSWGIFPRPRRGWGSKDFQRGKVSRGSWDVRQARPRQ